MTLEELNQGIELQDEINFIESALTKVNEHDFNTYTTITLDSRIFQNDEIRLAFANGIARALTIKQKAFNRL